MKANNISHKEINSGDKIKELLIELKRNRKGEKIIKRKRIQLTKKERLLILSKTDSRCHICGTKLATNKFQADHISAHSTGGEHNINNFLPACSVCNNYRWHYSAEEIQIILKLGVWARTKIITEKVLGREIAIRFVKHELETSKRRVVKGELRL